MQQRLGALFIAVLAAAGVTFTASPARAASELRLWLEAELAYRPVKDLELGLVQHLRFDENVSRVSRYMPELDIKYRAHKHFRIGAGYRLMYERDRIGDFRIRHRLHADAALRFSPGDFVLGLRLRFQEQIRAVSDNGDPFRHVLRTKARFGWRPNKWVRPDLSAELFVRLANGNTVVAARKLRLTAAWGISPGDHDVSLFYRVEIPIADRTDPTVHIVGLGYAFTLKHPKRKKKKAPKKPETGPESLDVSAGEPETRPDVPADPETRPDTPADPEPTEPRAP